MKTLHSSVSSTPHLGLLQVVQGTIRDVANQVFAHLHALDLRFHLSRQTGALNRMVDRGTRGINFILNSMVSQRVAGRSPCWVVGLVAGVLAVACYSQSGAREVFARVPMLGFPLFCCRDSIYTADLQGHAQSCKCNVKGRAHVKCSGSTCSCGALQVFNVVPTLLEVTLVAGILAYKCGPSFAILTGATLTAYTAFTFAITSVSSVGQPACRLLSLPAWSTCSLHVGASALLQREALERHGNSSKAAHVSIMHAVMACKIAFCHVQHLPGGRTRHAPTRAHAEVTCFFLNCSGRDRLSL